MFKDLIKISLLTFLIVFSACQKSGSSSGSSGISLLGDDTTQAVNIINDANNDLKEIKKIYKDNQGKVADLHEAISAKDPAKVKNIAKDLASQINDGLVLGNSAVQKIKKAEALNINNDFRQYLSMKEESLQKQLDAFDSRLKAAELLRDKFGTTNQAEIDQIKAAFKANEENFQNLMQEGQQLSLDANNFAKNVLRKAQ